MLIMNKRLNRSKDGSKPKFSIIVPAYNREMMIMTTIQSVFNQTFTDYELIVIDDGSTDRTYNNVSKFVGDNIRLIRQTNQGPEAARNKGAMVSGGEYLVFFDSDDILMPHALEIYSNLIKKLNCPYLILAKQKKFKGNIESSFFNDQTKTIRYFEFIDYYSKDRGVATSASIIIVSRKAFRKIGGWRISGPKTFSVDDFGFLLRAGCCGRTILIDYPATVARRMHADSAVANLKSIVEGLQKTIIAEKSGTYPGGENRKLERRHIIGGSIIYHVKNSIRNGKIILGLMLFFRGFGLLVDGFLCKISKIFKKKSHPYTLKING